MSQPTPNPVPPLIVAEGWDATFFVDEQALGRYIECWYPSEVEYKAFDCEGRKLELFVESEPIARRLLGGYKMRERVRVRTVEREPRHAEELRLYLGERLQLGAGQPATDATLAELLQRSIERDGYS